MGEGMKAPYSFETKEGYLFEWVSSEEVSDLETIHEKMESARKIGLVGMVIPDTRKVGSTFITYEVHYYRYKKVGESK